VTSGQVGGKRGANAVGRMGEMKIVGGG